MGLPSPDVRVGRSVRKAFGAVVLVTAALVPGVAQGATVGVSDPSPYSQDNRALVFFSAANGETNNLTVSLNGSAVIFNEPVVTMSTSTPTRCEITNSGHTATCTPKPEQCTLVSEQPPQPPVIVCTPVDPSEVPVPLVDVSLQDLSDTLVNNASIPSESFDGSTFPAFFAFGGSGNDNLTGSPTPDFFFPGTGDDTASGLGGSDFIFDENEFNYDPQPPDGVGDDHLFGGNGDDFIYAGGGNDELRGEAGSDLLIAGTGNNTIDGGPGIDTATYEIPPTFDANDNPIPIPPDQPGASVTLDANGQTSGNGLPGQNDTILAIEDVNGTEGADTLTGSSDGNFLNGLQGNDTLVGGGGFDILFGSSGADAIDSADAGADRVNCGGQADDTATVDDVDQVAACPDVGMGLTVIDTTPPETTIDSGPENGSTTSDTTPTFGFSSNEPGTFACRVDGAAFGPCSGPGDTHTTATLADGSHTFEVRAIDAASNVDPTPASRTFTVDTTPPETTITKGPKKKTRKKSATFWFNSNEANSSLECQLDNKPSTPCTSPKTYRRLKVGRHTFTVRATDAAGNLDPSPATYRWKVRRG